MKHDGAENLHVVGPLAEVAPGGFPRQGEGFRQKAVKAFAVFMPFAELRGKTRKFFRRQARRPGLFFVYSGQYRKQGL
jgi:hypothetical protein